MSRKRKASVSKETFDEFLAGKGMLEACEDHAIKELIAEQLAVAMQEQGITKVEMAARMKTSRRQLDRLFDWRFRRLHSTRFAALQARWVGRFGLNWCEAALVRGARRSK